jgi:hypothetical protein
LSRDAEVIDEAGVGGVAAVRADVKRMQDHNRPTSVIDAAVAGSR